MKGYQITFFTHGDLQHHGRTIGDWLLGLARDMGLRGATLVPANEGFGKSGRIHSAHFFELTDQPLEVVVAVTEDEAQRLFARLEAEQLKLFYVKTPVEFGVTGAAD